MMLASVATNRVASGTISPVVLVGCVFLGFCCVLGACAVLLGYELHRPDPSMDRRPNWLMEKERDLAAAVGMDFQRWMIARGIAVGIAIIVGWWTGIFILAAALIAAAVGGFSWAFAGRASKRKLIMERSFVDQLRNLRDRMAIGNQSLDTALQEIGRNPGYSLEYVLAPLARGGSVVDNIVLTGVRSRSPVVEYACAVLIWSRTRSLDDLIAAIDDVLLEVGSAQLAVQEEAMTTLSQQRAVTMAMTMLMTGMLLSILRVGNFRSFYSSVAGEIALGVSLVIFLGLVWLLGRIVRVEAWTRWNLKVHADNQGQIGA